MIPAERRKLIIETIEKQHSVSVGDLCERLDVSEMTIRRDLRLLNNEGLVDRVHGGAVARRGRSYEPPFRIREMSNSEKKRAIVQEALKLVVEGDSLSLDVGTTTLALAEELVGKKNLTVITSSLHIANVLALSPNIQVIISGGVLRAQERSMVGRVAERVYADFQVDKAFMGIAGINMVKGLTEYNMDDALVKKAIMENAEQIIVLADSNKFGKTAFTHVAPLSVIDVIVTDREAPQDMVAELIDHGIEVILADGY